MTLSFIRFSWSWLGGKEKDRRPNGSLVNSLSSLGDWGKGSRGEADNLRFYSFKGADRRMLSSNSNRKKAKRKWKSRQERIGRMDKEHDVVLVPSDGVCLSGSESDHSDWSIGWLEPHAPNFQSADRADNSFAVLVPCYRHICDEVSEEDGKPRIPFLNAVKNLPTDYSADGTKYVEQWLSYLQKV